MSYDLGDAAKWESMFPSTDKPLLVIPDVNENLLELDEEEVKFYYCVVKYTRKSNQ